jgi:aspartate aminotransferase-like enzyme
MSTAPSRRPPVGAAEYAEIEDRVGALLHTTRDVILLQGEAILGIEAAARGAGSPGSRALNVITSPYGAALGRWLAAGGAAVDNVEVGVERAATIAEIDAALSRTRYDIVSIVHAEAATGVVNPLAEVARRARSDGALVIADAVASVGAEPLEIDEWDLDITVIGAQKALGGPAGVCAVALGERAWQVLERNPSAPRDSLLSLLDWRERWLEPGRTELPLIPHSLETRARAAALDEIERAGLDATIERHRRARDASRAGLRALGLRPWIADDATAAAVATLVALPEDLGAAELLERLLDASPDAPVTLAPGGLGSRALRINHTGADARLEPVLAAIAGLAVGVGALGAQPPRGAALEAALAAWHAR